MFDTCLSKICGRTNWDTRLPTGLSGSQKLECPPVGKGDPCIDQTTNDFFIRPSFMIDIFPPLDETTNPIVLVIWLIPATDEWRVP